MRILKFETYCYLEIKIDFAGIMDDDIYAELEAQRDALVKLHQKQLESNEEQRRQTEIKRQSVRQSIASTLRQSIAR